MDVFTKDYFDENFNYIRERIEEVNQKIELIMKHLKIDQEDPEDLFKEDPVSEESSQSDEERSPI